MTNPAADVRANAQTIWPGASVSARNRRSITHAHPTETGRFMLDAHIGPIHYGASEDQEIDSAWEAGGIPDLPWLWKMVKNDFNVFLGQGTTDFDSGQILKYVHVDSGEDVTFEAQQLQWTNDLDQIEAIADPQQVSHTALVDDTITWDGAFGTGLDFRWQIQTGRLSKYLTIQSAGDIGSPSQFIIDGGNPVLRLQFIFQKSLGTEIWIDEVLWDEAGNNPQTTSGNVEFRLASSGDPLWWFKMPQAKDNSQNDSPQLVQRFRKTGPNLLVEVRVPWSWLQTASYPVEIDPTVDEQVGAGDDDATEQNNNTNFSSTQIYQNLGASTTDANTLLGGMRFQTVAVPKNATIGSGTFWETFIFQQANDDADFDVFCEDVDDAVDFVSDADVTDRVRTSASAGPYTETAIADPVGVWFGSAIDCSGPIQEIVDRDGWATGQDICVIAKGSNRTTVSCRGRSYDGSTTEAAKLHIEYTTGGGTVGRMYTVSASVASVTTVIDLLRISAPTDAVVVVHKVIITQETEFGDAASEQMDIQFHRGSTDGSGGATPTARQLEAGDAAFGGTVATGNTTQSTEGNILHVEAQNVMAGFVYAPTPEERIVLSPSGRLIVELPTAPDDSIDFRVWAAFEEIGG